jgi:hypothetical protein
MAPLTPGELVEPLTEAELALLEAVGGFVWANDPPAILRIMNRAAAEIRRLRSGADWDEPIADLLETINTDSGNQRSR